MGRVAGHDRFVRRRIVAALLLAPSALLFGGLGRASGSRRPTPTQTEGPFYPVELPRDADFDLLRNGGMHYPEGRPAWLEGSVSDLSGRPVAGAVVEIWQCDHAGNYHHPGDGGRADPRFQGFGRVAVGADGRYRFRTIRPARVADHPGLRPRRSRQPARLPLAEPDCRGSQRAYRTLRAGGGRREGKLRHRRGGLKRGRRRPRFIT